MPRKGPAERRKIMPDPIYRSLLVSQITNKVMLHGKRSIAFIRGPAASTEAEERLLAYREALQNAGIAVEARWILDGDYSSASGVQAVQTLLDARRVNIHSLDAVVAANDSMALGALEELHRRGIQVPGQLSLIGFDDIESARVARPTLTTVRQPAESIGREALRQLIGTVAGEPSKSSRFLPTELVVRRSCGCVESSLSQVLRTQVPSLCTSVEAGFLKQRQLITAEVARAARGRFAGAGSGWESRWVEALLGELRGDDRGGFARRLQQSLQGIERAGGDASPAQEVLAVLRSYSLPCVASDSAARALLEDVLHDAQVVAGALVAQGAAATARDTGVRYRAFARTIKALMFGDLKGLSQAAAEQLPHFGIEACVVARLPTPGEVGLEVQVLFGFGPGGQRALPERHALLSLVSHAVLADVGSALFVLPITLQDQALGVVVLSVAKVDGAFLEDLRELLSTVLKVVTWAEQ